MLIYIKAILLEDDEQNQTKFKSMIKTLQKETSSSFQALLNAKIAILEDPEQYKQVEQQILQENSENRWEEYLSQMDIEAPQNGDGDLESYDFLNIAFDKRKPISRSNNNTKIINVGKKQPSLYQGPTQKPNIIGPR